MNVYTDINLNPYSNTPIKNLEFIQNKALIIAPFEITKSGLIDTDLMLDTPGFITMYFFRKNFDSILKEPTAEQFKVVGTVSDISTKLGLDIADNNISSSSSSSYYLGFTKIAVIFKYDKNTGIRTIEKDNSLLTEDYTDISIDSTVDLTAEDYFVICNVTKNTKATNSSFTESSSMDFLFMIPSGECQEIITDFDILDANNQVINVKKYGTLDSDFIADNDITFKPAYQADFFGDGSNIATYLFDGNCNDETGNYNGTPIGITYTKGKFGQAAVFNGASDASNINLKTWDGIGDFTISLWINKDRALAKETIFGRYSSSHSTGGAVFGITTEVDGTWGITNEYNTGVYVGVNAGTDSIPLNTWTHLIVTISGSTVSIYTNGKLSGSSTSSNWATGARVRNTSLLYLGQTYVPDSNTTHNMFKGKIDNVRIFNRALNQREVLELYNEQPSYEEQLTLNEVTGKTLTPSGNSLVVYDKNIGPSIKFVNNRDYLTCLGSDDFAFNTDDFTIETWVKFNVAPVTQYLCGLNTTGGIGFGIEDRNLVFGTRATSFEINYAWVPTVGVWYHLATTRENGTMKLWINGSNVTTKTNTKNLSINTGTFYIGALAPNLSDNFYGNILQLHIVKGIAKYSSNFTPESRLLQTPNTVLLLQVDKPVINTDNWSKVQLETVETIGNNVDQPLSIVDPKRKDFFDDKSMVACYMLDSNANDETGMYNGILNGSNFVTTTGKFGQCVSVNDTNYVDLPETLSSLFGTNDFSISLWFKPSGTFVTYNTIFATHSSNSSGFFNLHINSNNKISVSLFDGDSRPSISHQDNINLTDWNHVVVTKKSNVYTIYSNNIISGSTLTNTLSIACTDIRLGQNPATPTEEYFSGQLNNVKIFNRALTQDEVTSLYNETISPIITLETETETIASEPDFFNDKSNIATYLFNNYNETDVLNLLGEDFTDVTNKTIINNGVIIDTTNKASGSGSYKFSNNSYISLPTSNDFIFGTDDFTFECDFYLISSGINGSIILEGRPDRSNGIYFTFGLDGAGKIGIFSNGAPILTSNTNLVTNKWYHLSCKRRNGIFTLLIDGVLDATSGVTSINFTRNTFIIGKNAFSSIVDTAWVGNIDNIKLSRHTILDANGKYNGTATNITYEAGKFGNCANFDGTSKISSDINLNSNNFSISFWGNLSNIQSTHSFILSTINGDYRYGIRMTNFGKLEPNIWTGVDNVFGVDANWSNYANAWTNYVFSINNNTCYFYINGELKTTKTFTNNVIFNGVNIGYGQGGIHNIAGQLDNVRIFNRALTASEVQDLYRETKRVKYKAITLDKTNFGPAAKFNIETQKEIKLLNFKTWIATDETSQGYRIYPVMKIQDHTAEETSFSPKYYLGAKYQRNLAEVLLPALKSKRTISNLKDMYLVDDQCIQTLKKINILLETDQMIKFTERLYNLATPLREKLNADLILEYLSIPVTGTSNNDITETLKTSLIEDYNFTQSEIDNLNDNLNTFKSRARMNISTPVIQGSDGSLDQVKFSLPQTFVDGNRSQTEKKNLLVFGTDAGFNKFGLSGYSTPYSNVTKRDASVALVYSDLVNGLTTLNMLEDVSTIKDVQQNYGDETLNILFENGNLYAGRYVSTSNGYAYCRDGNGISKTNFGLKLIKTNVKTMACQFLGTFVIDNNNDVWATGGSADFSNIDFIRYNSNYDIFGINSSGYLPSWTKVFSSTPENTPKKVVGIYTTTWLLMESGEVFCTGYIPKYYTFDGIQKYTKTWTSITTGVKDIDCGDYYIVYTMQNGDIYVGNETNENGVTTQSNNTTATNLKVLKILTNWIPTGQNITQIECTNENIYYLLSNGDVYGVGGNRGGQLQASPSNTTGISTPKKLYSNVKRIIPQLFGRNDVLSALMVELNTGEIKANGSTIDYKFGYYVKTGVVTPITLFSKVDKIFLTELTTIAIINGVMYLAGYNRVFGENTTNKTFLETKPLIALNSGFKDILTNYKQQIPFSYIPLSTDINEKDKKPVFETLTNITGFSKSEIIIDIPNVL